MKRALLLAVLTAAVLAIAVAPALAEGYNDGGWNYESGSNLPGYGENAGIYVRSVEGTGQVQSFAGPHGGYTTTTNKCQDCHSTHYALGSYMLLRANDRENACTFCHAGGGGSSINIQMDNAYDADGVIASADNHLGTGHTLGYSGKAPADIEPAFTDTAGLACFSCHTPHGNSARVLEAFGSPSHRAGDGRVNSVVGVSFMATQMYRLQESMNIVFDWSMFQSFTGQSYPAGSYMPIPDDLSQLPHDLDGSSILKWSGTTATEIGSVIDNSATNGAVVNMSDTPTYVPGDPMPAGEVGRARAAFYAWGASPTLPPSNAQMMAWRGDTANFGTTPINGKYPVTAQGVGALFSLFGVTFDGSGNITNPGTLVPLFTQWKVYWGEDVQAGNVATAFLNMGDYQISGSGYSPQSPPEIEVWHKPLFAKGRFLLLKNPDTGDDIAGVNDMGMPAPDYKTAGAGEVAGPTTGKKQAIDWEWPIGPAATWGPFFSLDSNERFPLAFPWAPKGVAMQNELCTSCHDGAAGMATQPASVWLPTGDGATGQYITAYSHDSNNRGCARAQYLNPEDDNNFGPHCANCHTGASGCWTCHSEDGKNWKDGGPAYGDTVLRETESSYYAPGSIRTSAVVVGYQCIDGGFSFPHRTLGANMLKDALYGVDFDGTPVKPGETRSSVASATAAFGAGYFDASWDATTVAGQQAHDLDSVCIDCHGDGTFWNGDDSSIYASFTSTNPLNPAQTWTISGWELLLKGLP